MAVIESACGGAVRLQETATTTVNSSVPTVSHAFIIIEENHSYREVIGNANMPDFSGLAPQYYANAHSSLPNYFELTAGRGSSIAGLAGDSYVGAMTQDNVVRSLNRAGKTCECLK